MAQHPEVDIRGMTEFMPTEDSEGKGIDQNELLDCVAGYEIGRASCRERVLRLV